MGLDRETAAALLAAHAAAPVDPAVGDRLAEQTGGNPLALIELPLVLSPGQLAGAEPLPRQLPLTDRVERAFLERARRLPDDAQAFLLVAAAEDAGRPATVASAAALLGVGAAALDGPRRPGWSEPGAGHSSSATR